MNIDYSNYDHLSNDKLFNIFIFIQICIGILMIFFRKFDELFFISRNHDILDFILQKISEVKPNYDCSHILNTNLKAIQCMVSIFG